MQGARFNKQKTGVKVVGRVDLGSAMSLPDAIETLSMFGDDLSRLSTETEAEFLEIGSSLQLYFEKSSKISSLSASAASQLAGDELSRTMDASDSSMSQLREYIDEAEAGTERRIERLKSVLDTVKRVQKQMDDFVLLSKNLHILGVTAKIHAPGDVATGREEVLAGSISLLSKRIGSKAGQAASDLKTVITSLNDALRTIHDIKSAKYRQMRTVLIQMSSDLRALKGRHDSSRGMFDEISAISQAVSKNIEEVVVSAQYQDITRQKFQKAADALNGLCEICAEINGMDLVARTDDPQEAVCLTCERIVANLLEARSTYTDAVESIIDNLSDVSTVVSTLSSRMHDMAASDWSSGHTFLQDIGEHIGSVVSELSGVHKAETEAASAIAEAGNVLLKISSLIEEINGIGDNVEIVAMNAAVRSAQSNGKGSAMKVLSGAIRKVSDASMTTTHETTEDLNALSGEISALLSAVNSELKKTLQTVQDMEQEMGSLVKSLGGMNESVAYSLQEMDREVGLLSSSISKVVENTESHRRVDKVVGAVVSGLSSILDQRPPSSLRGSYGMPGRFTPSALDDKGTVELSRTDYTVHAIDDDSGFGNNIELFD